MVARVLRSLFTLGALVGCYLVYALTVSPWIEPQVDRSVVASRFDEAPERSSALGRHQAILARYFSADHWALTSMPKVFRARQFMLVLDDYDPREDGRLVLTKFVAIFLPKETADGAPPPQEAVVLEAPGGGWLEFDQPFNPVAGRIGNITSGEFPGPITIRSNMRSPGPEDDLLIRTSDLKMNGGELYTDARVDIRQGKSTAGGRRMAIRLLQQETGAAPDAGPKINGVRSIEIFDEVRLALQVGNLYPDGSQAAAGPELTAGGPELTAGGADEAAASWGGGSVYAPRQDPESPPVEVTCRGSFKFDLVAHTASLKHDVQVWQLNLAGQSDQLMCQELRLHFKEKNPTPGAEAGVALRPQAVEAIGQPVKIDSPSRRLRVRCDNLLLQLDEQTATVSGRASIVHPSVEVAAPVIRYRHPPHGQPAAVGDVWLAGPGNLRAVTGEGQDRSLEANWQSSPDNGFAVSLTAAPRGPGETGPVARLLSLIAAPRLAATDSGAIACQRIDVLLREAPADGPDGPALEIDRASGLGLLPERIDAVGPVEIDSPRLLGRVGMLAARFAPPVVAAPQQVGAQAPAADAGPRFAAAPQQPALTSAPKSPADRYALTAARVDIDLQPQGRKIDATALLCEGGVELTQLVGASGGAPVSVRGHVLRATNLQTGGAAQIDVLGGGAGGAPQPAPAESAQAVISARGLTLHAAEAHLDQATNRMWADGPGDADVRVERDLLGGGTPGPTDLHLRWRGGLRFDGQRISVRDEVLGEGPNDWLRCREMTATLTQAVDLTGAGSGGRVEIAQVDCVGGVAIDHRTTDAGGQRSHERAKLVTLSINQQTGAIEGAGPGWVRSVHLSAPVAPVAGAAPAAPRASLHFLRIDFQQGLTGNLNDRVVRFHRRVQAVYGPVDAWEQQVELDAQGRAPVGSSQLVCEELQAYEDPALRFAANPQGPDRKVELRALGGVRISGAQEADSRFEAEAESAVYNQLKELFVLEGDARRQARLSLVRDPTRPPGAFSAQKISYWRGTGQVKVEGLGAGQFGSENAPATAVRPTPTW